MPAFQFNAISGEAVTTDIFEFSLFKNIISDKKPETITLDEFIEMVSGGEWYHEVSNVRESKTKESLDAAKKLLPAVTISGTFSGGHGSENIVKHSGLICIDFDVKDNQFLDGRIDEFRNDLGSDQFSRFVFASASGKGLAVICRVEPDRHGEAFEGLSEWYRQTYGLKADKSCKDVSRLRFASWDDSAIENTNARTFKRYSLAKEAPAAQEAVQVAPSAQSMSKERKQEIRDALGAISNADYDTYIKVGMALHSECSGMDGLNLWMDWAEINDERGKGSRDAPRAWRGFGQRTDNTIQIETLFKMALDAGWGGPPPLPVTELPLVSGDSWIEMQEAPRRPVIENFIDEGEMGECIAPSKTRKSFFTMQLAMCVAAGREFLGFNIPERKRVMVVNMEITAEWQHRRMLKMARQMNFAKDELSEIHFANTRGLNVSNMPAAIIQTAKILRPALIIVDPLYFLHDGDENAAKDMMPVVRDFMRMMKETGAAVIMVHHDAKGKAGDRNIRDRGAGSSVFGRACDSRIVLTPQAGDPNKICVETMCRNFAPREGFVCQFDGYFHVIDEEMDPETSSNTKGPKKIDLSEVAQQASGYLHESIMRTGEFRQKVLIDLMGLGVRKAEEVTAYMGKHGYFLKSSQQHGGYWISANQDLINEKNFEIEREKRNGGKL